MRRLEDHENNNEPQRVTKPEINDSRLFPNSSSNETPNPTKNSDINAKTVIGIIVALIFASFAGVVGTEFANQISGEDDKSSQTSNLTNNELKEYTSVEHGFKAAFPGFPEIERDTFALERLNIPYTAYTADKSDGSVGYLLGVYDYTGVDIQSVDGALEGAVNGAVQNTQGATLITADFTKHESYRAISAYYTAPIEGQVYDAYMLALMKSGKMYSLFTIGGTKIDFDLFVNSFELIP